MKKIILFSFLLGLITNTANATYYKTTTNNCSDANMMATLDSATAAHRAVITEVTCDYIIPELPAKSAKPAPRKMAAKHYVHHTHRAPAPQPVVKYEPTIVIVSQTTETCTCFDCGC